MGLRERIAGALFGDVIAAKVAESIKAASVTDKEDEGWRRLTGDTTRNLSPLQQDRMINIAFWLWENNPMGKWLMETTKSFLVAKGLPYEATNAEVKKTLDAFWKDPINRMDLYLGKFVRELFLYGELCLPVFVAKQTGRVRLGYIDPSQIKDVVTDPENVKTVIGIVLKDSAGKPGRRYKTALPKEADYVMSPAAKALRESYTDGDCFFFAVNNVTNSPRGRSDLLVTADWLDAYEQFLFDYSDRWPLLNAFLWDLKIEGATPAQIKEHLKDFSKKSGSVFGHNEKMTLEAKTPDLKAADAETGSRVLRNHILGAHSIPEHWFGGGGDVNRATAVEMDTPAYKALSEKQEYVKYILETILGFSIEKAREARYLQVSDEEAGMYSVITPEISSKDLSKYSTVLRELTTSLVMAENQGWTGKDTTRKIFVTGVGYLGVKLDQEQVKAEAEEEAAKKGFEDYRDKGGKPPEAPSRGVL